MDEITLGECDMTSTTTLDEMPSEKPVTPKRMNLGLDKEPEAKCEVEKDCQAEGKKAKKKEVKKEKAKRENIQSRMLYSNVHVCSVWSGTCVCARFHVCTCTARDTLTNDSSPTHCFFRDGTE